MDVDMDVHVPLYVGGMWICAKSGRALLVGELLCVPIVFVVAPYLCL